MGRRGTKPKPAAAHKLSGTYQKCRHKTAPVASGNADLVCPDYLDGLAAELWLSLAPRLNNAQLVEELDQELLASMCRWWAIWRRRDEQIQEAEGAGEEKRMHGLLIQAAMAQKQWQSIAVRLGMSPTDRQALRHNAATKEEENPILRVISERSG